MTTKIVQVPLRSDGNANHRPKTDGWTLVTPAHPYLEKLATMWMKERGREEPGVRYYLNDLPAGYSLYEKRRLSSSGQSDKHLYGHPDRKYFDSPNRFYPHFANLMRGGRRENCTCSICASSNKRPGPAVVITAQVKPPQSRSNHQPIANPAPVSFTKGPNASSSSASSRNPSPIPVAEPSKSSLTPLIDEDDEYTPDVIRELIDRLKVERKLNEQISENLSMEWRAERNLVAQKFDTISKQQSWIPRQTELVLFVRDIDGEICPDGSTGEYKLYDEMKRKWIGTPKWEAGVVTQVPEEKLDIKDILSEQKKANNVNIAGFRIEPFPSPNKTDKSLSKRYAYLPTHHIRPFVFWQEFLRGSPRETWHPTIKHALIAMSTISLVDKLHFKGTWPRAAISCRAAYIGSELLCVGDAVRIRASHTNIDSPRHADVLHIAAIKLHLSNLDMASNNDADEGHPYNSTILFHGKAFTTDPAHAYTRSPLSPSAVHTLLPTSMHNYDAWYPLHAPSSSLQVPFSRLLSRVFEADAMALWFPSSPSINKGTAGLLAARKFAAANDTRIVNGKTWFWADSRAEALDLHSLNGFDLAAFDPARDAATLTRWSAGARLLAKAEELEKKKKLAKPEPLAPTTATLPAEESVPYITSSSGEEEDISSTVAAVKSIEHDEGPSSSSSAYNSDRADAAQMLSRFEPRVHADTATNLLALFQAPGGKKRRFDGEVK